jgi:hypothetical protein
VSDLSVQINESNYSQGGNNDLPVSGEENFSSIVENFQQLWQNLSNSLPWQEPTAAIREGRVKSEKLDATGSLPRQPAITDTSQVQPEFAVGLNSIATRENIGNVIFTEPKFLITTAISLIIIIALVVFRKKIVY